MASLGKYSIFSELVFLLNTKKSLQGIITMELTYIEIKKTINAVVTRVISEINDRYSQESIQEFLKKYECIDERQFIEKMICQLSESPDLSIKMRETINDIEDESHQLHFELSLESSQNKKTKKINQHLLKELKALQNLKEAYNERTNYLQELFENVQLILSHNNLDFEKELKKLKPNAHNLNQLGTPSI